MRRVYLDPTAIGGVRSEDVGRCRDCRHWSRLLYAENQYGGQKGICSSGKFLYHGDIPEDEASWLQTGKHLHPVGDDVVIYRDYEDNQAFLYTGQDFGCLHWSEKPNKNIDE